MDAKDSDLFLIEKAKTGDEAAFEALVIRHQDKVYNICRYMLGECDADDAAQDTFVKAYRNLANFIPAPNFSSWISRIAVNTCLDYRRRPQHLSFSKTTSEGDEYEHEEASCAPGPESCLESKRAGQVLTGAIARLSDKLRAVLVLAEIEGFSYEETAAALDINVGTVKSRLFRAREELKKLLIDEREQI